MSPETKETVKAIGRAGINDLIDEWIVGRNAERNRQILKRRLIDGICFERLAEESGLSVEQAKRVVYTGSKTIFSRWKG